MTAATPPSPVIPEDTEEIRLADLLDTLLQHIWIVVGFFAVALAIGIGYAVLATPIYKADALIQIEQNKSGTLGGVQEIADMLGAGRSPVSGEIAIITSREVILQAVATVHADVVATPHRFPVVGAWLARRYGGAEPAQAPWGLRSYAWGGEHIRVDDFRVPEQAYGRPFVLVAREGGYVLQDASGKKLGESSVGQVLEFSSAGQPGRIYVAELKARPGTEFFISRASPVNIYKNIIGGLNVEEAGRQSNVVRVSYRHHDIAFAQDLVNGIAKAYLTQNVERRSAEADQSLKFLDEQLPTIKRSVERAEEALNSYRTRTNTVSVEKSIDMLLGQSVEAEKERLELQMKRDQLRQLYRPEHPELKALESQIAAINDRNRTVNDKVSRLPAAQRDLLRLQRDAEVSNQLYIALLNNAQQLKVAKAGTVGNVRVIDYALKDTLPVAPKRSMIVAASAVIGLVLGIGGVFLLRLLRPTVRDVAEIERATGLVSYATVPESSAQARLNSAKRGRGGRASIVPGHNQLLAMLSPSDVAVESLRSLRTGLTFATLGAPNKNIVITGATASLGKSFISANLSALLASSGKRVLLVETDMRRPQLSTYFGQRGEQPGLSDVLAGAAALDRAVVKNAAATGLDVLFAGQVPPNPGELLLSSEFEKLVDSVQDAYDYVILDSAPVLPVGDTLAVARVSSAVFMVVRAEQSTVGEVKDAIRKLESAGSHVKGVIFNGVKRNRVGYGYAYRYYYGYGSKA